MSKWPKVRLGDCCTVVSGATPKTDKPEYWDGDIKWVTPKDVSKLDQPYLFDTPDRITRSGFESCSTTMLPAGSVLVTSRAPIGNIAINAEPMCTNQGFKSLIPGKNVDALYLYFCMKQESQRLADLGNGATFKEVSKKIVEDFEILLPPLAEQKRIAAILDKADSLRRKRAQAIALADDFLRAIFLDMFGDPVTNPKGWPVGTIRDLVASVNYGTSSKADEAEGQYPILRMMNITYEGRWDFSALKYIDLSEKEKEKYLARKGDLLFNRTNSKELVGKSAVFESDEAMAIAGYLIRVRTNELANPYYIAAYLNSPHGKQTLFSMCKSIVGMANINAQELQDIRIQIPPVELQNKYASIVAEVRKREVLMLESEKAHQQLSSALASAFF